LLTETTIELGHRTAHRAYAKDGTLEVDWRPDPARDDVRGLEAARAREAERIARVTARLGGPGARQPPA
jgi:hypothetical protein